MTPAILLLAFVTLERLADRGNGHYGYIDGKREAEKRKKKR